MALDKKIFGNKTLSDLFSEIHGNSSTTRGQVKSLIGELKPLIENIGDATLIVPMIKEYMEIGVKNDDALIKMAAIIQRIESAQAKGSDGDMWDPAELAALLGETEDTQDELDDKTNEESDN
jgi:hypothetical protein|tara:strand:+ start:1713 stop:2078 length:366 start_codon:yes stop_codon:yes gene_type:complete